MIKKLLLSICLLLPSIAYATDGSVLVIDKIAPKNGAFVGVVDSSQAVTNTTNFNNNLSASDNTVQKALDTLDNMSVGAGSGSPDSLGTHVATKTVTANFGITGSTLNLSQSISMGGVSISTYLAGAALLPSNSTWYYGYNNRFWILQDSNLSNSASVFNISTTKDFTLNDSTGGTNSNEIYGNLDGDYTWGVHMNAPSSAKGQMNFASGSHGADGAAFIAVADSTNSYVFRGWHSGSTHNGDLLRLDSETTFASSAYPSQTPSYSGTFGGNYLAFYDRSLPMFKVGSEGAAYSYDPTGTEYIKTWHNGNGGIIQTNTDPIALLPKGGTVYFYNDALNGLLQVVTDSGANVSFDVTGSSINFADTVYMRNNKGITSIQDSTLVGPFSAVNLSTTKDWTLAESTTGTNSNELYSNLDGNYAWGTHVNMPSTAQGQIGYAGGGHADDSTIFTGYMTSTNSYLLHGFQAVNTNVSDAFRFDAEKTFQSGIYPGLTPSYSGTFSGNYLNYLKRDVPQFKVDNAGGVYSYDPAGTEYVKMWHNGNGGIIQTNAEAINLLPAGGTVYFYSPNLSTNMGISVANTTGETNFLVNTTTVGYGLGNVYHYMKGRLQVSSNTWLGNNATFYYDAPAVISSAIISGVLRVSSVTASGFGITSPTLITQSVSGIGAGQTNGITIGNAALLSFDDLDGLGGNIILQAPDTVPGIITFVLPSSATSSQIMQVMTDGSGNKQMSFTSNVSTLSISGKSVCFEDGTNCQPSAGGSDNLGTHVATKTITAPFGIFASTFVVNRATGTTITFSTGTISSFTAESSTSSRARISGVTIEGSSMTFESGSNDPVFNWSTNGQLNFTVSTVNVSGKIAATYVTTIDPPVGIFSTVSGVSAGDIGSNTGNVMVGTYGQAVTTRTGSSAGQHAIGVLGLAQDNTVVNGTADVIGIEGRTIGAGQGDYTGALGFLDFRGTGAGTNTDLIAVEARSQITTNGVTAHSTGTMKIINIPAPTGKGRTDDVSWSLYGASTYPYYMNGNVGISSANPANKLVVKTTNAQMSVGEPTAAIAGLTFENGPITTSNYNLAGAANSVYLNRPTGGTAFILENNSPQVAFSPTTGDIVSIGGFTGSFVNVPLVLTSTLTVTSTATILGPLFIHENGPSSGSSLKFDPEPSSPIIVLTQEGAGSANGGISLQTLGVEEGYIGSAGSNAFFISVGTSGTSPSTQSSTPRIQISDRNASNANISFNPSNRGFVLGESSMTFDSGSSDPVFNWSTDGQLNYTVSTVSVSGKIIVSSLTITALNCSGNLNGGALTTNANGVLSCSDDDGGAGGGDAVKAATQTFTGANTFTSTITYTPAPALVGGLEIKKSSITFDSGSSDPILNWSTDGQFNISVTTTNFAGKVTATTLQSPAGSGLASAVYGLYAADIGADTGAVMAGTYGQAVNTRTGTSSSQHAIGALGLAQDVANATSDIIGAEGRTIGQGVANDYIGVLGFLDYRGTAAGTNTELVALEARGQITSNGVTATSTGTMKLLNIPAPTGKGKTDNMSWSLYGASTYPYYMNGNVGISSANPVNNLVVKTAFAQASIGEPTAGISGITFENGPISLSNYAMAGFGGSVYLNRGAGGTMFFAENNTSQVTISPTSGDITTIGKLVAVSTVSGAGVSASTGAFANVLTVKGRNAFSGEVLFSTDPYTNTSTFTLKNVEGLRATIAANTTYFFDFVIYSSAAVATTGLGITVSTKTLVPVKFNASYTVQTGTTTKENQMRFGGGQFFQSTASGGPGPFGIKETTITGNIVSGNTGGTIQVQFVSEVNASGVTVMPGCYGTVYPIISP